MEIRNWGILIIFLALSALVFNFLRTIFKADVKKFSQERLFVDYNTYKKPASAAPGKTAVVWSPVIQQQVELANRDINVGRSEAAAQAFTVGMHEGLANSPVDPDEKPNPSGALTKYAQLAAQSVEGLSQARLWFSQKNFTQALADYQAILPKLDKDDFQHLMQVYDSIAECSLKLNNKDGYVENKLNYVKTLRSIRELMRRSYSKADTEKTQDWITPEEATRQLLKVRSSAERMEGPEKEMIIRRAEFDVEVARRVN